MDAKPRETQRGSGMHRDKKVGLAMGILLVGIVAAFFFRNESDPLEDIPPLEDALALDEKIATQSGGPYLTGVEPVDDRYRRSGSVPSTASAQAEIDTNESSSLIPAPDPIDTFAPVNRIETITDSTSEPPTVPVGTPFDSVTVESRETIPNDRDWESVPIFEPDAPDESPKISNASQSRPVPTEPEPEPEISTISDDTDVSDNPTVSDQIVSTESPAEALPEVKPSVAEPPAEPVPVPRTYRIRPGDTLSEIAWRELGSSRRYHELYEANRDRLQHPDNLPIGMELRIPTIKSKALKTDSVPRSAKKPPADRTSDRRFIPSHRSPIR